MINISLIVRQASFQDHQQIASLLFHEANLHRHLDWRSPLDWLGSDRYWVLKDGNRILAVMACPEDPPGVSWIRVFGHLPHLAGAEAWRILWETAKGDMDLSSKLQVAAIALKQWFQTIMLDSGFAPRQSILSLELRGEYLVQNFPLPSEMRIRPMLESDLPQVARLDLDAFGPFWHNTQDSLARARSQSVYASVVEDFSGPVGYQISTGNPFGAHLARLGVRKQAQNRGLGAALVCDLVRNLTPAHSSLLTVNTQSDNAASLALYKKLGFIQTGDHFPVLIYPRDI